MYRIFYWIATIPNGAVIAHRTCHATHTFSQAADEPAGAQWNQDIELSGSNSGSVPLMVCRNWV
jgi:hypothetical protein